MEGRLTIPRTARTGQEEPAIAEARAMGANAAQLAGLAAMLSRTAGGEGVWPVNVEIVVSFLLIATQWRTAASAKGTRYVGLDYAACRAGLEMDGMAPPPEIWRGVRQMEAAARDALNGLPDTE